jgi:hypothetical protein
LHPIRESAIKREGKKKEKGKKKEEKEIRMRPIEKETKI